VTVQDVAFRPVPSWPVKFDAPGVGAPGTFVVFTNSEGVAAATVAWAVTGTYSVTATAIDKTTGVTLTTIPTAVTFLVDVKPSVFRGFDELSTWQIATTNSADMQINLQALGDTTPAAEKFLGATLSTIPNTITYTITKTAGVAEWGHDLFVRTRSQLVTSTARFTIAIRSLTPAGVVQTTLAQAGPFDVTSAITRYTGALTHVADASFTGTKGSNGFNGSTGAGLPGGFDVLFTVTTSSDSATPGIEVIVDDAAPSRISCPGPVVTAVSPNTPPGTFLVTTPDPRQ